MKRLREAGGPISEKGFAEHQEDDSLKLGIQQSFPYVSFLMYSV